MVDNDDPDDEGVVHNYQCVLDGCDYKCEKVYQLLEHRRYGWQSSADSGKNA